MGGLTRRLEAEVSQWPHVSVVPHRFVAREFRFEKAEIGHCHTWGDVDIPFTRAIRDLLIGNQLAQTHRWVPASGWITFHMDDDADLDRAIWLIRLSYLRYALKVAPNPEDMLRREATRMGLDDRFTSLLVPFISSKPQAILSQK